jgi:hypothetical protein
MKARIEAIQLMFKANKSEGLIKISDIFFRAIVLAKNDANEFAAYCCNELELDQRCYLEPLVGLNDLSQDLAIGDWCYKTAWEIMIDEKISPLLSYLFKMERKEDGIVVIHGKGGDLSFEWVGELAEYLLRRIDDLTFYV